MKSEGEFVRVRRGHCRIVVVSSMAAVVPAPGQAMYAATKLALHGYFQTLQSELNDRHALPCLLAAWQAPCCTAALGKSSVCRDACGPM